MSYDTIIATLFVVATLLHVLFSSVMWLVVNSWTPKVDGFAGQIQKLLWVGSVRRAIEVCDAVQSPDDRLGYARVFKALLLRERKVGEIDATLHYTFLKEFPEGLRKDWQTKSRVLIVLSFLTNLIFPIPLILVMSDPFSMKVSAISLFLMQLSYGSMLMSSYKVQSFGAHVWPHLLNLRSALYLRARVSDPIVGDLVPLTPEKHEELVQKWALSEIGAPSEL